MFYQGPFSPKNPKKYKGDPTQIIFRSRWEYVFMKRMDEHPDVLEWSSEELTIPYRSPKTGRIHRYFPDFLVKRRNTKGVVETVMVEIKPKAQILPPKKPKKATTKTKTKLLNEQITFAVNQAKWEAARAYCKAHNYLFEIITEKELF